MQDGRTERRPQNLTTSRGLSTHAGSDHHVQFVERDGQPPVRGFLDGQFVVTSPKVLDERVSREGSPSRCGLA
jgi:hypothetical protein